ncbi:MAG: tetratricopeptide repeat protein [Bacteroidetes bacterium]|nr:tetratricopeptide repeat protein [Bacteroidota bacterium]
MRFTKVVIFASFWGLLLLAGCSTTNHAPLPSMVYHDITGHYNAYFNANERLKAVYVTMDKTHKDNYKEIIPLYTYSDPKEASAVSGELDEIEKHLTNSVQIHKVSNWADDDFLMMGKAVYIKGNYERAQSFFKYTTTEYKNGVDYVKERRKEGKNAKPTLKKKPVKKPKFVQKLDDKGNMILVKVDERPHYTAMIHEPARAEALLWLAKSYAAQKKFTEAASVIQFARSDDKFYKNLDKELEATEAEIFLRQKNYHDAIKPLETYVGMEKKKLKRVRPLFILAQIYERNGDYKNASDYYKLVLKNRPNYDMEFYAKINRAKLGSRGGNSDDIRKLLTQMSRDGKYKDYYDQVWYELGMIALNSNDRTAARKDFQKSVALSTKNADQKALSYLKLAQMDYEDEAYVTSKYYYDTTMQNMAKEDTSYPAVESRDKTLAKLVKQIDIITTEDSLQRIAGMSSADRLKFIHKLLDQKQKEADAKEASKGIKSVNSDFIKPGAGQAPPPSDDPANLFYFYNVTAKGNGYSEFVRKWGRRKLEDNWRRKDKSISSETTDATDSAKAKADSLAATITPGSEDDKMLAGLPLTPEKIEKSNAKLVDAYYEVGTVYKDDLQAYRKAINAFDELNKRFPGNKLELESWYQLYLLYGKTKNNNKAELYKGKILDKYPDSKIAQYLKNPEYLAQEMKKQNSLNDYYDAAYNDYATGMYASAEQKIAEVDAQFKENQIRAKFDLLNAQVLAKENRLGDYVQALNKVIKKYPGTPEKDVAQTWLTKLNSSKLPQVDISKLPKDSIDAADMASAPVFTDTTGNADFLTKVNAQRPKTDAVTADAATKPGKAGKPDTKAVPAAKDTAAAPPAKPYVPLTKAEAMDSAIKARKAIQDSIIARSIADRKAKQDSLAALAAARKAAQDSVIAHNIAARKAHQDSIAAANAAKQKAREEAIARNIAEKKARQDSIAAAQAAKAGAAGNKPGAKTGNTAAQDSLAALVAARKAKQDSMIARTAALKKAAQDSIDRRIAARKALQDSLNAAKNAAIKAKQDSINARLAARKAAQDSIATARAAADRARQDSINAKKGIKPAAAAGATPPAGNRPKTLQERRDSMLAARAKDSIDNKNTAGRPKTLQERRDSMLAANAAKASHPKTLQERRDSMLAARAKDSLDRKNGAAHPKTLQERRDSMLAARAAHVKDSIAAAKKESAKPAGKPETKPVVKETPKATPATAKATPKDTVKPAAAKGPSTPVAQRPAFDSDTTAAMYGKMDNAPHGVVIWFLDPIAYNSAVSSAIDKFDAENGYTTTTTRGVEIDKDSKLVNIKSFKDKDAAMAYISALKAKLHEVLPALSEDQYFIGAISTLNYSTLVGSKAINNYRHFYRENYK